MQRTISQSKAVKIAFLERHPKSLATFCTAVLFHNSWQREFVAAASPLVQFVPPLPPKSSHQERGKDKIQTEQEYATFIPTANARLRTNPRAHAKPTADRSWRHPKVVFSTQQMTSGSNVVVCNTLSRPMANCH